MKLLATCDVCKKKKLLIKKRQYDVKRVGKIESRSEMCGKCFKAIQAMLKQQEQ